MIIFDMIHKYAGTIDVVSDDVIVEIKSGRKERWHQLQVAAYALAYRGYFGNEPKGIHLAYTKTGEVVTIDNLDYLEDIFVSALNIARWKNETRKRPSRDTDFDSE
jgi:CRISPR/Cas system-associated exonuclease Cas4 (RecB family)